MKTLTNELIQKLLSIDQAPCLSLYMPTHRSHPDNLQDVTRFKSLIKQLEKSLSLKYSADEVKHYIEPFETLAQDKEFWNHTLDGLAVFSTDNFLETVRLQVPVNELGIVADSFHTKPLRQYLQSGDRYHILGLSLHEARLFEGNRYSISEIKLPVDFPKTMTSALGDELTEKHLTAASYGGIKGESSVMFHGHGSKKDEMDKDAERFFRVVANAVHEDYSKPADIPLILAALPEHFGLFQKLNKNPHLLTESIAIDPYSVSTDKLRDSAWKILEPEYLLKLENLSNRFEQAKADGKGSDDLKETAVAAVGGRVDTLIIEADRMIARRLTNLETGNTQKRDLNNPKADDFLDDIGELVTKMGGRVMVFPPEKMPSQTGLAAIFRY